MATAHEYDSIQAIEYFGNGLFNPLARPSGPLTLRLVTSTDHAIRETFTAFGDTVDVIETEEPVISNVRYWLGWRLPEVK